MCAWVLAGVWVREGCVCVCSEGRGVSTEFCCSDRVAAKGLTFSLLSQAPLECWDLLLPVLSRPA